MNKVQIGLFILYVVSMWAVGSTAWQWICAGRKAVNRAWYAGESFLLGGIIIVAQMLLLSLVGLYKAPFLWGIVVCNLACLFLPSGLRSWFLLKGPWTWNPPSIIFLLLVGFFMFRNCYFLMDVDSHSTYLYTQKLWLEHGSSLFAGRALDMKVFVPQFNAVPYALGLSIFPAQTFFPQLVVAFWTVITLLLVYGYLAFRLGPVYGLAGAMLVLFNDHMYFSGANTCVVINSALIAFLFAAAVNFWEARRIKETSCMVLAFVFWTQILINKYQLFYVVLFLGILGCVIQPQPLRGINQIFFRPRWAAAILFSTAAACLWFMKNWLATGLATFPILAGEFGVLGWTKEMEHVFNSCFVGPLPFTMILKYFSYLCIWPGINADKILVLFIIFLPFIIFTVIFRRSYNREAVLETCYWFILATIYVIGICMVSFVDPRPYRYGIALSAAAAVWGLHCLLKHGLKMPVWAQKAVILLIAVQGWRIMFWEGGDYKRPFIHDNWLVLTDRLHMQQMAQRYYPDNIIVSKEESLYRVRLREGAWDIGVGGVTTLSAFLLPTRPQVGLWYSTAINWSSYGKPVLMAHDLEAIGIKWIMNVRNGHMFFENPQEYAQRAASFNLHPADLFYNYGFPSELSVVRY